MRGWLGRARERDGGAAAVEFALLVPVFFMLVFGMISGGITFWHQISLTQGARDAARFGSTLTMSNNGSNACPPASGSPSESCWLQQVASVAVQEGGWSLSNGALPSTLSDNGYVCVAFVASSQSSFPTQSYSIGSGAPATTSPCLSASIDTRTDARVQVVIGRDGDINLALYDDPLRLSTRSVIQWERGS